MAQTFSVRLVRPFYTYRSALLGQIGSLVLFVSLKIPRLSRGFARSIHISLTSIRYFLRNIALTFQMIILPFSNLTSKKLVFAYYYHCSYTFHVLVLRNPLLLLLLLYYYYYCCYCYYYCCCCCCYYYYYCYYYYRCYYYYYHYRHHRYHHFFLLIFLSFFFSYLLFFFLFLNRNVYPPIIFL